MKAYREELGEQIVREQAARWVCDLREGDPDTQTAFLEWVKRSPRHVQEFLFANTAWREAQQALAKDTTSLDRLIVDALADEAGRNVVPLEHPNRAASATPRKRKAESWVVGLAAACAAVTISSWWMLKESNTFSTEIGEHRTVRLEDGSLLNLNTQSRVKVHFSATARDLQLIEGEALFTVKEDTRRPFRVTAGETVIQALGTQFDVYRRPSYTRVAVISGVVQIQKQADARSVPQRLTAGQRARIEKDGRILTEKPAVEAAAEPAWRERRLVFQGVALAEVASEFNRYNRKRIRVEGEAARGKLLSGSFNADDPGSLMLFLEKLDDVTVRSDVLEFVIQARDR